MPRRLVPPLLLAVLIAAALVHAAEIPGALSPGDAMLGLWITEERDARFEIYKCGIDYCGRISRLREPYYPPTDKRGLGGLLKMDRRNPDPALRNRPLLGLTIFEGFRYEGGNTWRGRVYNPEDGKTYKCRFSLSDNGDRLKVRGYIGVVLLGRTQTWTRQPADARLSDGGADSAGPGRDRRSP
ncbi:MAG: DUF2147 domain-containing protein [Syntrophobacteraceae bacterium]